jgi:hypothetical protein
MHILLFPFYALHWGIPVSLGHTLFGLAVSWVSVEVCFFRFRKIAFTCSYLPGRERLHYFWLVYFVAFLTYVFSFSWIEAKILGDIRSLIWFLCGSLLLKICLRISLKFSEDKTIRIKYDESPPAAMQTLDL